MKAFFYKLLTFSFLILLLFSSIVYVNYLIVNSTELVLNKNKNILILGDSTAECAINDTIFKSAINYSSSGDSYFYSYLKLKKILKSNSNIDTLLVSFSPHNIFNNTWLLSDSQIFSRFRIYYPLMSYSDFKFVSKQNPNATKNSISKVPLQFIKNITKNYFGHEIIIGGFIPINRDKLSEAISNLELEESIPLSKRDYKFEITNHETLYLKKIINVCEKENIKLYLINMPKRKELLSSDKYGVKLFEEYYLREFKEIDFIDLSQVQMPKDYYGDFIHLNDKGANYFSRLLESKDIEELLNLYKWVHN